VTEALPGATGPAPEVLLVNGRAAREVSALERALHYGDGLFETIACIGGQPRLLRRHLRRLGAGCARIGIEALDLSAVAEEVRGLAAKVRRAVIKVLVSRGPTVARGYGVSGGEQPTRIVLRYPWPEDDPALALRGVRVRIAALRLGENPALAGLKHCNRLEQVLARREWNDPGISEALLFSSSGALVSGTMSNVFLVLDGRLLTPRVDLCGVAGVMRELVLATAAKAGIAALERRLERRDLSRARELFLTNALTGIRPVRELEEVTLAVGPRTQQLQTRLAPSLCGGPSPEDTDG
jgi:4-amino-4-deoxychorismate lyase